MTGSGLLWRIFPSSSPQEAISIGYEFVALVVRRYFFTFPYSFAINS